MLVNDIKISLRSLRRYWTYSLINIFSLSAAMTCCLLIGLYVFDELSFDSFHQNQERVYRVITSYQRGQDLPPPELSGFTGWGSAVVGPALLEDYPEISHMVRMSGRHTILLTNGDQSYQEEEYFYADPEIFEVFSFSLLQGDPTTALVNPQSIVLSETAALRYFGSHDVLGRSLILNNDLSVEVTGVMAGVPQNSHLAFDMLISMSTAEQNWQLDSVFTSWGYSDFFTYVMLQEGASIEDLRSKMSAFATRRNTQLSTDENLSYHVQFEALEDVYLSPVSGFAAGPRGNAINLLIFSIIAVFILIIACVNFMNLATARAVHRAKEVGIRKYVGAQRTSIMKLFLVEFTILALISMVVAYSVAQVALPLFNALTDKNLAVAALFNPELVLASLVMVAAVGFVGGLYPALVLSSFRPEVIHRGLFKNLVGGKRLRESLIVFQFGVSVMLIACTHIVFSQLSHMRIQELGFNQERMLVLDFGGDAIVRDQIDSVKQTFLNHPAVRSVTAPRSVPGSFFPRAGGTIENAFGQMQDYSFNVFEIDYDFIPHFEIEMVAGRAYRRDFSTDLMEALIINEAAAREIGYLNPADVIGKPFSQWGREGQIIGVVDDFNFVSLQSEVEPLTLSLSPLATQMLVLRLDTDDLNRTIIELNQLWQTTAPHRPFLMHFLDEEFDRQYATEAQLGELFSFFASLAVLIACTGLFGLATFTIAQRRKEIGVRKVLGATAVSILRLLSKEFVGLVVLAFLAAIPLVYFAMNLWLEGFAYRIEIGPSSFLLAGMATLVVAFASVAYQSLRASVSNPIDSIRFE